MKITAADNRGTIIKGRNSWRINNALVEEVSTNNRTTGHLIVSYAVRGQNNMTQIELLRLNVNRDTIIRDQRGRSVCLCDIRPGMWIDTEFSSAMTSSIPPQTTAFRIVVRQSVQPSPPAPPAPPPPPPSLTTTDRIVSVDTRGNFIITGVPNNINRQTRFNVTNETVIVNRSGRRIQLRALQPGQSVRVTHANFQTRSIPPQTTAFRIQVL